MNTSRFINIDPAIEVVLGRLQPRTIKPNGIAEVALRQLFRHARAVS